MARTTTLAAELRQLAQGFVSGRRAQGFSPRTLEGNRHHLERFASWIETKHPGLAALVDLSARILEDYTLWLTLLEIEPGRRLSLGSRWNEVATLRTFFRKLARDRRILADPTRDLPSSRRPRSLPRGVLSVKEIERVLAVPDLKTPLGLRDRAILEVFYSTGIRNSELAGLTLEDLNLCDGLVTVRHGKGDKGRVVPLGRLAQEALERYLETGRGQFRRARFERHVFLSWRGYALRRDLLHDLMGRIARAVRFKKPLTCHGLRHSFATHMLAGGADIRHIQEILGHKHLSSTQVYTHVAVADLKRVHERCHPRERHRRRRP